MPSIAVRLALLCLCLCALASAAAAAKTHHLTWNISYQYKTLDCGGVRKLAVAINGEVPGPTIRATQGDTLAVTIGTPWADGTAGVTQCPILPGETFTYRFVVDRPGTYMYHAHYGMQRVAGLDGMLVVSVPDGVAEPFAYDEEHTVLLMDWWHKSVYEQAVGLASVPMVFVGEPQSLLINGRGVFKASNASGDDCSSPPTLFTAVPGKTYRLRIGSLTSLSSLSFAIEGHTMTVVEADGYYVTPATVTNLFIYSGETYSVLLTADQNPSRNYWATSHVVSRKPETPPALAVVRYATAGDLPPPPPAGPAWDDTASRVNQSRSFSALAAGGHVPPPPPARPDRVLLLLNTQDKTVDGHTKWFINGVSLAFPETPYLISMKHNLRGEFEQRPPPDSYDHARLSISSPPPANTSGRAAVYRIAPGSVVDVVLQNTRNPANGKSETHPWHLHGHDFWVLGYGEGKFDPEIDGGGLMRGSIGRPPVMKNTVALHPMGWTAVRFVADNPGVWLFHCHLEAHVYMGMGVVFEVGVERVPRLPAAIMGCGRTKGHH
uniref:L-ascorbate oxidase n=1 Tax=Leersia perrieri TaxID=77586 RepID=A0A0D9XFE7_9ORYZ